MFLGHAAVHAQSSVTLAWDPSPSVVAGYYLYWGGQSRTYTNLVNAGTSTNATVTGLTAGRTYYFAATARDSAGVESDYSNEVMYTVPSPNTAPVISSIANQTININQSTATLNFTVSDSQTPAASLTLTKSSSNTTLVPTANIVIGGTSTNRTVKVTPATGQTGSATITIRVSDGSLSASRSFTVKVNPLPTITLTSPSNGAKYSAPATVSFSASVVTNGNTIKEVKFYNGTSLLGQDTSPPYTFSWSAVPAGTYSVKATVTYGSSATVSSAVASVTVTNPVLNTITLASSSATLTAPFYRNTNGLVTQNAETTLAAGGRAVFSFTTTNPTNFIASANVIAAGSVNNSLFLNIDAEPTDPTAIWDIPIAAGVTNRPITWRGGSTNETPQYAPKVFMLPAGTHQFIVRGREANTQFGDITLQAVSGLSGSWAAADIGATGTPGLANVSGGDHTLRGAGVLGGGSDTLYYLYQPLSGDGEIKAQLASLQNTGVSALAGVMIRESLTAGSKYSLVSLNPAGTFQWRTRETTALAPSQLDAGTGTLPNTWLRLVRRGNSIYSYKSSNGTSWTTVAYSTNMVMATNIWVGLAVASGVNGTPNTSVFKNVTVVP